MKYIRFSIPSLWALERKKNCVLMENESSSIMGENVHLASFLLVVSKDTIMIWTPNMEHWIEETFVADHVRKNYFIHLNIVLQNVSGFVYSCDLSNFRGVVYMSDLLQKSITSFASKFTCLKTVNTIWHTMGLVLEPYGNHHCP